MLSGRLGLETARVPHTDRHGLLWLSRGNLSVADGTLRFVTAGSPEMKAGEYAIPFQTISMLLLGPGTTLTHDVLRLAARHGTGIVAVGENGVRMYTAPPWGTNDSALARRQVRLWAKEESRVRVARRMYAIRFGGPLPQQDIHALRGIEGTRVKEQYVLLARKYGIEWKGRRYDRKNPEAADLPNQAINHAATAVEAAAAIAVAATGTIPQLGFIHEDSTNAFCLDLADLYRAEVTLPIAFEAVREHCREPAVPIERHVRRLAGRRFKERQVISGMIERIKELLNADDGGGNP